MNDYEAPGDVDLRHIDRRNMYRGDMNFRVEIEVLTDHALVALELRFECKRLAVAAYANRDGSSRGSLPDQTFQPLDTLNRLVVDAENHIVFFDSGFAGGRVLIDRGHLNSTLLLQVELSEAFGS